MTEIGNKRASDHEEGRPNRPEAGQPSPTLLLHAEDTYLLDFEARVVAAGKRDPEGWEVALDRTAFYAESGGQPSDQGILAGHAVLEVVRREGVVWHLVAADAAPLLQPGALVEGLVDAPTRLDHMRQHTGQHILSQAFVREGGRRTESFHLGKDESTIDLSGALPDGPLLAGVQETANGCILADRPIRIHQVSRADLDRYPLRKDPTVEHQILRLIEIEDYDWSACGGTHARRTGEVGPILVLGVEKAKAFWRVRFLAGDRALRYASALHHQAAEMARRHSVRWDAVVSAVDTWRDEAARMAREIRASRTERGETEAERVALILPPSPDGVRRFTRWLGPGSPDEARALARRLTALGPGIVLLGWEENERAQWICAGSSVLPPDLAGWDARGVLQAWLASVGGQGGGSALFAQGSSRLPTPEEIKRLESVL